MMFEKCVSGALVGAIGGGALGLVRGFLSNPGYIEKLTPRPECFDMDASAPKLFYDISKYRYVDETAYVEALHNVDSMFCLEKQLVLKEVTPQLTDPPSATQMAIRALTHLRDLRAKIPEEAMYEEMTDHIKA